MPDHSGLRTVPGDTAFTRRGASSAARARVYASIVPAVPVATTHPGEGRAPTIPLVSTIDPAGADEWLGVLGCGEYAEAPDGVVMPRDVHVDLRDQHQVKRRAGGVDEVVDLAGAVEEVGDRLLGAPPREELHDSEPYPGGARPR
jgi:hypothetical protein